MLYPEKMLLKLPAGTLARIDAVCGNRSDWIRGVIEDGLGVVPSVPVPEIEIVEAAKKPSAGKRPVKAVAAPEVPEPVKEKPKEARAGRWDADKAALLSAMGVGPCLPRKLEERLGWTGQRVDRVAELLVADGKVSFAGGVLEVVRG